MKAIRRYYWLTQKFLSRHYKVILRTTFVVLVLSSALIYFSRYLPTPKQYTRIGLVGKFSPETLPLLIQSQVSQGLVTVNADGDPEPALAKSWVVSEDKLVYTFLLDPDIKWHDGSSLKPEDVVYNFKEVESSYEEGKVIFKLKEPFAPFMNAVARPILKNSKIGTGQFSIIASRVNTGVVQSITLSSPKEKLTYKFYPTETSAITAFKLGEIDKVENISYVADDLLDDSSVNTTKNSSLARIAVLFFNNNDNLLTSKTARQGLAYAIKDKTFGYTRALSPIDQESWAYNPLVKDYEHDAGRAKALFSTDIENLGMVKIELKTSLQYLDIAEAIANDWRQILGIAVDVKVVTNISSDYQVLLTDFAPPSDPDQYTVWHSTQPTNFTHYSNLKIDKLLEDGRRTMDKKLRIDIYQDFQSFLLEDSPAVFLFRTSGFTIERKPLF